MKQPPKLKPGVVAELPVADIHPDPDQPRTVFHAKRLQELADNIKARGIQQPITVRLVAGRALINTGERRWRAAKLAGLMTVPVLLDDVSRVGAPIDVLIDQLAENDLRDDLNPMEHAESLAKFQTAGMGPTEISDKLAAHGIHMARSTVSNLLRLNGLPEKAKELVRKGTLKESYARELLPFVDPEVTPKIVNTVVKELEKLDEISPHLFRGALAGALQKNATRLYSYEDKQCTKKACKCLREVPDNWGGKDRWCLDEKALAEKRAEAERRRKEKADKQGKKQEAEGPIETDPTKAKPVKVKLTDDGVVATRRLDYDKHRCLEGAGFDKTPCEGCPHRHLASRDGKKVGAEDRCFYPPCFENLSRQHTKASNRKIRIREMLDEQMLPELLKVAASPPVAAELLVPLLSFHAATRAGEHYSGIGGLSQLPEKLKRGRLNDYLLNAITDSDVCAIVEQMVMALPGQWRHELALHLCMNCGDWWKNTESFAKLFTKDELKAMLPNFDPPDVPVGEWRQRLMNDMKTPAIVAEVWVEDWVSPYDQALSGFDDDEELADSADELQQDLEADGE